MIKLLVVAMFVMFLFALIAAARSIGTFLTVDWAVWLSAGFVAWSASLVIPILRSAAKE